MKNNDAQNSSTVLVPCPGTSYAGLLAQKASAGIRGGGSTGLIVSSSLPDFRLLRAVVKNANFIIIDGCGQNCMRNVFETLGLPIPKYLNLTELGISNDKTMQEPKDDLELVRAGILATTTPPSDIFPRIPGCCCG